MKSVQPKYGYGITVSACLWLGLFPLLQGGTYARLTHDKWIIMLILTGVTLLCFLFDRIVLKSRPRARHGLLPFVLASALMLWSVLSCICSSYGFETWFIGKDARYEGLASQLCYFTLFGCFFFSRIHLKPVLYSAAAGVACFFTIVLLQRTGGNPLGLYPGGRSYAQNPEFQGTIGNIDMGTGYLVLVAGLFLFALLDIFCFSKKSGGQAARNKTNVLILSPREFILAVVCLVALLLALYLAVTMGVQFGAIALGVLFVYILLRFLPRKARLPVLILLIVIVLLTVWFWPGYGGGIWELHEIVHGRGRLSFGSNRVAVWVYSLGLAKEALFLGGGSGTFQSRFNTYLSENDLTIPTEQDGLPLPDYFDTTHNEYLSQLTDHGLPALLLFVLLLFAALFRRREGRFPLLAPCSAAVLCYAVQATLSFSVCIVAPMFWVLLGISFRE